jgi:transaldolase
MKRTTLLHEAGQSLWIDNLSRAMLDDGTLERYVRELCVTGLTSNPTTFDKAITGTRSYDPSIRARVAEGKRGEELFLELALEDLRRAADLFEPAHRRTAGVDGWVSIEVSPLFAHDADSTIRTAKRLREKAGRPNLFVKIPGTREGLTAIEESIFAGVPINVTLLFSREQYLAAANAYLRGIERRIDAGLDPVVPSVASIFVSRWDVGVKGKVPAALSNKLGLAVAGRTYRAYRELLASNRWQRLANRGARAQRLLWASTGVKDPAAPDLLYVEALAAPHTIDTMPDKTLLAYADHGRCDALMPVNGGDADAILDQYTTAGIDLDALAERLQQEGVEAFANSWRHLLETLDGKANKATQPGSLA